MKFHIDPRGPKRTILSVEKDCQYAHVTLSCGHTVNLNVLYSYPIGDQTNCYSCMDSPDNLYEVIHPRGF